MKQRSGLIFLVFATLLGVSCFGVCASSTPLYRADIQYGYAWSATGGTIEAVPAGTSIIFDGYNRVVASPATINSSQTAILYIDASEEDLFHRPEAKAVTNSAGKFGDVNSSRAGGLVNSYVAYRPPAGITAPTIFEVSVKITNPEGLSILKTAQITVDPASPGTTGVISPTTQVGVQAGQPATAVAPTTQAAVPTTQAAAPTTQATAPTATSVPPTATSVPPTVTPSPTVTLPPVNTACPPVTQLPVQVSAPNGSVGLAITGGPGSTFRGGECAILCYFSEINGEFELTAGGIAIRSGVDDGTGECFTLTLQYGGVQGDPPADLLIHIDSISQFEPTFVELRLTLTF